MKGTRSTGEPPKDAKPEEIEKHIERTRADLGRTVEALQHKLDVRSQARERMVAVRGRVGSVAASVKALAMRPVTMIAAGVTVVAAGVAGAVAWKRRH
jgi:hypothetical protein